MSLLVCFSFVVVNIILNLSDAKGKNAVKRELNHNNREMFSVLGSALIIQNRYAQIKVQEKKGNNR